MINTFSQIAKTIGVNTTTGRVRTGYPKHAGTLYIVRYPNPLSNNAEAKSVLNDLKPFLVLGLGTTTTFIVAFQKLEATKSDNVGLLLSAWDIVWLKNTIAFHEVNLQNNEITLYKLLNAKKRRFDFHGETIKVTYPVC